MLVCTARTSFEWQPAVPQVSSATRRSPGLTNRIYSLLSFIQLAAGRTGLAELRHISATRGFGEAGHSLDFALVVDFDCASDGRTVTSPPWQSVQPRRKVLVVCMVGESVCPWHAMQPVLLLSASS